MSAASAERVLHHFREQAFFCEQLGSPFTRSLCLAMADDIEAGGPVARLVSDWNGNPRRDVLALRIAAYLHHATLTGRAADLAASYPAATANWNMETVWPLARDWLDKTGKEARTFIASPPQTNETRRAIALLPAFLKASALCPGPVHLLELGASAGLNQNWDRFNFSTPFWERTGSSTVTIGTDWNGPPPDHLDIAINIVSRAACDQNPIDVTDPEAVLRLKSYIWPDQTERLQRLEAAVELARHTRVHVEKADALDWLRHALAHRPSEGLTLIYHSVFLQYPSTETREALRQLIETEGQQASWDNPLAWACFEPAPFFKSAQQPDLRPTDSVTYLKTWPGGEEFHLLRADSHVIRAETLPPR